MPPPPPDNHVAVVGSPSTNSEITLDLLHTATRQPLVGQMLYTLHPVDNGQELALGVVSEVTTVNQWHANPLLRGVVKTRGEIPGMTGDTGDVRAASIKLQACYRTAAGGGWVQAGPAMRMSPPTGTPVSRVTADLITDLTATEPDLHSIGHLHGTEVPAPFTIGDFSGPSGAWHGSIFGVSGSGKSAIGALLLAGQMRHTDHGMIIIDPQGQFASETGMPFSLQGWAAELGREVVVRRIAEDIRLAKDAPLFADLLTKTRFTKEITKMSSETAEYLLEEVVKLLKGRPGWDEEPSEALLRGLLADLASPQVVQRIYADIAKQTRLTDRLLELLDDDTQFVSVLGQFAPLHNLFSPTNPGGGRRHPLWGTIAHVFDSAARAGAPAPLLILDMSTSGAVSWISDLLADEEQQEQLDALAILDQDAIKAAILRQVCRTLKRASEDEFRRGHTLNTMVVLDEAWRYAPPPANATDPEIKALSQDLAGYARDTRKFGIGWFLISQAPRSLNPDLYDQLTIRLVGFGLGGNELARVAEQLDDPDHVKLYRGFSHPQASTPKVFPFMVMGPVSPLALSRAPMFIQAYTDFDQFRADNERWISQIRAGLGLPVQAGAPSSISPASAARRAPLPALAGRVSVRTGEQIQRVREHRSTGGVDVAAVATGLSADGRFTAGLDSIDDEPPF